MATYKTLGSNTLLKVEAQLAALAAEPSLAERAPALQAALAEWRDSGLAQDQARQASKGATVREQAAIARLVDVFERNVAFVVSVLGKKHPDIARFGATVRRKARPQSKPETAPEAAPTSAGPVA